MISKIKNKFKNKFSLNFPLIVLNITLVGLVFSLVFMIFKVKNNQYEETANDLKKVEKKMFVREDMLKARAIYILDIKNNKVLFAREAKKALPLASISKLMTVYTAREILPKESLIKITKESLSEEGDSGLLLDEKWKLADLIDYSLLVSSNDGARSIASVAGAFQTKSTDESKARKSFILKMNQNASDLGLKSFLFKNETGLDGLDYIGAVGSAEDVARLVVDILEKYPDLLEATKVPKGPIKSLDKVHIGQNTNDIVNKIPNVLASKTGFTDIAGGNLVMVFDVGFGRPVAIVVLGSTQEGRFEDMLYLASSTINFLTKPE
jgi:D-alanyl-D-alanine carboxypeptidase